MIKKNTKNFKKYLKKHKKTIFTTTVIVFLFIIFIYSSFIAKKRDYEIKFVDGSRIISLQYHKAGEKLEVPEDPEKDGMIFVGWYYNNTKIEEDIEIYGNMKIEAAWNFAPTTTTTQKRKK